MLVQHHATNQLHIKMAHAQEATATFTHHGKGFNQNVIEASPFGNTLFKLRSFGS